MLRQLVAHLLQNHVGILDDAFDDVLRTNHERPFLSANFMICGMVGAAFRYFHKLLRHIQQETRCFREFALQPFFHGLQLVLVMHGGAMTTNH